MQSGDTPLMAASFFLHPLRNFIGFFFLISIILFIFAKTFDFASKVRLYRLFGFADAKVGYFVVITKFYHRKIEVFYNK